MPDRLSSALFRSPPRRRAGRGRPSAPRPGRHQARPGVESLESRLAPAAPTVAGPTATAVTPLTAVLGGNLTGDGGNVVIRRGVVLALTSVNPNPTLGGPGVTVVDTPPEVPSGAFAVTAGPLAPNSAYSFRAFATNNNSPNETGYSPVATFSTSTGIVMPASTVSPASPTDYAELNKVLFFQPTPGMTLPRPDGTSYLVPTIPTKQITLTNNLDHTVYPFMRDAAATVDPAAKALNPSVYQGLYDPIDQLNLEYRGYVGYQVGGVNYLGLPPGMTVTVNVPLAFWDGARMEIATDGTYLVNDNRVNATPAQPVPNPFQYFRYNADGSETARVALPAASASGGPAGATGMVMWYRQGLNNQTDPHTEPAFQANAPADDAPSQLIEWTIRDPVLSILNPNIDALHPYYGETHANINYDVSYVDSMALPVAMAALDVPVPVQTVPPLDPRNPNPGPRLPFGWIGAAQSYDEFLQAVDDFTSNDKDTNGLGEYFGGLGWPQYYLPAGKFPGGPAQVKIPSGQDALSDSPLARHTTSYDAPISNHFMLTSGGTDNFSLVGAGGAYSDGTTTLRIVANNPALQQILQEQLHVGMNVAIATQPGGPTVPAGTRVLAIGPAGNPGFHFTQYEFAPNAFDTVLEVQLNNAIPKGTNPSYAFQFNRPTTDYVTTALVNLWYTWAKYYVDHVGGPAQVLNIAGQSLTTKAGKTNQIQLAQSAAALGLVPGMLVTGSAGSGLFPLRPDQTGATTIESIDPADPTKINLSQAVDTSQPDATYSFFKPSFATPAVHGADQAMLLVNFNPTDNEVAGVPHVLAFAQFAYQLVSLMSQIPSEDPFAPISAQVLHNVIGGNITKAPLNGDAFHKTEVAFRDKVKSLLRGVNDFTVQTNPLTQWYPDPSYHKGGQHFNVYNLDPFVWFVHKRMGLSGYGFSLDDDAADISGNFSTHLGVAIGGLNGLPNHFEWSNAAPYGPVSADAKVLSGLEIAGLPPYAFFSAQPYNANEKVPGANLSGTGVPAGTYLYSFGNGGLYAYSYLLSDQPPPNQNPLPPPPSPGPLQIPPLVVNGTSPFTLLGPGTANALAGTLPAGPTTVAGPYMNTLRDLTVPAGGTLTITSLLGNLTSYTQQVEQMARVSTVATPDSQNGQAKPSFVPNAPLPDLDTVVNGELDAGRVEIVDGSLSGTGTVKGSLSVYGPVGGYADPIVLKPVNGEPVDPGWDNPGNAIRASVGGTLVAGTPAAAGGGTPGKLTVTGDVSLFGATFTAYAGGAGTPGGDYSWLASDGRVSLGNSSLDLSLLGYTPKAGDALTLITAAGGVTGRFGQGTFVRVGDQAFSITYNPTSVVLTPAPRRALFRPPPPPAPPAPAPAPSPNVAFVSALYTTVLYRAPDPAGLAHWVRVLDGGTPARDVEHHFLTSPEYRNLQVDWLYAAYLRRAPDPAGRATWVEALSNGLSETEASRQFLASPEYAQLHPGDAAFVTGLYADVLGRAPDPAGLDAWTAAARQGLSRAALAEAFLYSPESSRFIVRDYYTYFLHREPDAGGLESWSALLQNRQVTPDELGAALVASDEFFALAAAGKL